MEKSIAFRAAVPADVDALASLVERYYAFDKIPFHAAEVRAGLHSLLADSGFGSAWFIELDGRSVGYVVLTLGFDHELGGPTGTITDLFIEAEHRNRGLGGETLTFVEDQAREMGLRALQLQATLDNNVAQKLYRKKGFEAYERVPMAKRLKP
jgi:GNAT superfamily N-acetyltransferase